MKVLLQPVRGGFDVYTVTESKKERLNSIPVPKDRATWAKNEIYSGRMDVQSVKACFSPSMPSAEKSVKAPKKAPKKTKARASKAKSVGVKNKTAAK